MGSQSHTQLNNFHFPRTSWSCGCRPPVLCQSHCEELQPFHFCGIPLTFFFPSYLVSQSCPPLYNRMNCTMPGLPVLHCLPEFAQTHVYCGEGNGNPLQCSAWRIPGMGEPGGLPSMGLHRVGRNWRDLAAAAAAAYPSSWWCPPTISSSVVPFSSRLQSFPASGS